MIISRFLYLQSWLLWSISTNKFKLDQVQFIWLNKIVNNRLSILPPPDSLFFDFDKRNVKYLHLETCLKKWLISLSWRWSKSKSISRKDWRITSLLGKRNWIWNDRCFHAPQLFLYPIALIHASWTLNYESFV